MSIKINIPTNANKLIHALQNHGYSAYVVGGCVRDSILGREPHDWDICTSATPDEMLEIFKNEHVIPTGLQHGTITVMLDDIGYEVTTFRCDGDYSDGRHPDSVNFTLSLVEDLCRRDFTMNAMAYNDEEGLIDPFGGLYDIEHKIIRCVGNPYDRFNEDGLRIMRALRFASQLNFMLHQDVINAINDSSLINNLDNISAERINNELCKILSYNRPSILFTYEKVLCKIIPEFTASIGFDQHNPYHVFSVSGHINAALRTNTSNDLIVKLALFFHDIGKPYSYQEGEDGFRHFKGHGGVSAELTDTIMKRLKFDNETRNQVVELVQYHDATFEVSKKHIKRWLNKIGEVQFRRLLEVRKADIKAQNPTYTKERIDKINNLQILLEEVLQDNECFTLKDLAINGKDLIAIGFHPGKELGETLNYLLQLVIDGVDNDKEALLTLAKSMYVMSVTNQAIFGEGA